MLPSICATPLSTTLFSKADIPIGRFSVSLLGMYTLLAGIGLYSLFFSLDTSDSKTNTLVLGLKQKLEVKQISLV
jgi:hypothetical protein